MSETYTTTLDELVRAGHLELGDGYRTKRAEYGRPGLPILRVADVHDGRIEPSFLDFVNLRYRNFIGSKASRPGDIVLTTKGTVGRVAMMPDGAPEFVYSPQVCYFRVSSIESPIKPHYLFYWFKSEQFLNQAMHRKGQTDMADYINLADIRSLKIELPPRAVQSAVANVLGALDNKIAINESCIRVAHQLLRLHFQEAMDRGSVTTTVGDVAAVFDGPHATPEKTESGPWFLSISSLREGRLVLAESARLGEQDFARWTRRVTPLAGDVLFSYETRLGQAALMPEGVRACLGRRMALLRPRADVVGPRTLLQAYLSESFQETIRQRAVHGATVDRVPLTELPGWPISVPEQADQLEALLGAIDDNSAQRERENETLVALRDTLLQKLMSRNIRVRDAEAVLEEAL
jgi:type I restriction enzyme S subunit